MQSPTDPTFRKPRCPPPADAHPVTSYGAIQVGEHRFCRVDRTHCQGIAPRFRGLWRFEDGEWRIARMVRYAYRQVL